MSDLPKVKCEFGHVDLSRMHPGRIYPRRGAEMKTIRHICGHEEPAGEGMKAFPNIERSAALCSRCEVEKKAKPLKMVQMFPCTSMGCANGILVLHPYLFVRIGEGQPEMRVYMCDRCGALVTPAMFSAVDMVTASVGNKTVEECVQERGYGVEISEGQEVPCLCGEYNYETKAECGLSHKTWCPVSDYEHRLGREWKPGAVMPRGPRAGTRIEGVRFSRG